MRNELLRVGWCIEGMYVTRGNGVDVHRTFEHLVKMVPILLAYVLHEVHVDIELLLFCMSVNTITTDDGRPSEHGAHGTIKREVHQPARNRDKNLAIFLMI